MNLKTKYKIELAPTLYHHWYAVYSIGKKAGKETFLGYFPSSTTILTAYPQALHLTKWIAEKGWNESQRIKSEAGESGTNVHNAVESLLNGVMLSRQGYSLEEWQKISTFVNWYEMYKPMKILGTEMKLFSKKYGYAGTADAIIKINDEVYLIDWKTSGSIYKHFPLQFASYAQALEEMTDLRVDKTAALQMGASNKNGFRFLEYPDWRDYFKQFLNVKSTWQYDEFDSLKKKKEPPVIILPDELSLDIEVDKNEDNN